VRKLTTFGNLNQYAIKPAPAEINAMASFGVRVIPHKHGRRVGHHHRRVVAQGH
jgi:hypothetical protein